MPQQEVLGDVKAPGAHHCAAIGDATLCQDPQHGVVIGAEGIGAASDRAATEVLQLLAALGYLVSDGSGGQLFQPGMGEGVVGNLKALIGLLDLLPGDFVVMELHPIISTLALHPEHTGIEVKSGLETVFFQQRNEGDVLFNPIVIAECKRPIAAPRPQKSPAHWHDKNPFLVFYLLYHAVGWVASGWLIVFYI